MNNTSFAAALTLCALFVLSTGCTGARQTIPMDTPEPQISLNGPPELPVSGTAQEPHELSQDEKLLFGDDQGWEEDSTQDIYSVADPLEKLNRIVFTFNDKLYFWFMKPVAQGYRAVVPQPARSGVKNFFNNISSPIRIVNNILQGKGEAAEAEWAKFLYNSTVGVLGFGDPAKNNPKLNPPEEDLGQTLAKYGMGDGFFLMLPVLGPSTLRDSIGIAGDRFLNPMGYIEPFEDSLIVSGYNQLNNISFRIGDYESIKKAALDPYEAIRNAYIQLRQSKIRQ